MDNMLNLCLLLLSLGIVCLVVEMFLSGFGVFGGVGLLSLTASAVLAVMYVPNGWIFVVAEVIILAASVFFFFAYVRKRQLKGRLILDKNLMEDKPHIKDPNAYIGKEGITLTTLRPFGDVLIDGEQLEVTSEGLLIERDMRVEVVKLHNNRLVVRAVTNN